MTDDEPYTLEGQSDEMLWWLLSRPRPQLVGRRCTNRRTATEAGGMEGYAPTSGEMLRCSRPQWGDGSGVQGMAEGLCSRCAHEHFAFHSAYTTMQANPAASALSGASILRRTDIFGRAGEPLPGFTFPVDWTSPA